MNLLRTTSAGAHDWDLDPDESADLAESSVRLTGPVMVVDDEPMVRKSLANAIERIGARVVTAGDGEEALRKFRELHSPLVRLIDDILKRGVAKGVFRRGLDPVLRRDAIVDGVPAKLERISATLFVEHRVAMEAGRDLLLQSRARQQIARDLLGQKLIIGFVIIE
jgi:CheY-like chemotaxis protein